MAEEAMNMYDKTALRMAESNLLRAEAAVERHLAVAPDFDQADEEWGKEHRRLQGEVHLAKAEVLEAQADFVLHGEERQVFPPSPAPWDGEPGPWPQGDGKEVPASGNAPEIIASIAEASGADPMEVAKALADMANSGQVPAELLQPVTPAESRRIVRRWTTGEKQTVVQKPTTPPPPPLEPAGEVNMDVLTPQPMDDLTAMIEAQFRSAQD